MILEVCVDSTRSAVAAAEGGADRLELCGDLIVGGITPSLALFEQVRKKVSILIHVLLRPRFGDFLYDEEELEIIKKQAALFSKAGADTLVIGCLTADGRLDCAAMSQIMEAAGTTPVNLHRAFDMCRDLDEALEDARRLGIVSILTSGGRGSALEGREALDRLKRAAGGADAPGCGPEIMAAAGVNAQVIRQLRAQTCLTAFHMSGKMVLQSAMEYRNPHVSMGLPSLSEYEIWQTDAEAVRAAREALFAEL